MRSHGYHVVNPETVLLHGSLRHPSPMQGVLMDDVMQGELWTTCMAVAIQRPMRHVSRLAPGASRATSSRPKSF